MCQTLERYAATFILCLSGATQVSIGQESGVSPFARGPGLRASFSNGLLLLKAQVLRQKDIISVNGHQNGSANY